LPFAPEVTVGVPGLPAVVEALTDGRYDLVHVSAPGPAGVAAALVARVLGLPLAGAYHTELAAYAALRSGDPLVGMAAEAALGAFYGACQVVLSPSAASDARLQELGVAEGRVARWDRGVDVTRFNPERRLPGRLGPAGRVHVLHAGRLTREKDTSLLASAFLAARERDPRLHLVLAGGGPEEAALRERLGEHATFLGWLDGVDLAIAYASADCLLFCSQTETFGQVVLESQASGLPVVAVAAGGPAELIADGRNGLLCPPDASALGAAVAGLAASRAMRRRLGRAGVAAARDRSWESALARLASGWRQAQAGSPLSARRAA
jgi:glycosyltransferase involved in cell wall biosynthesis